MKNEESSAVEPSTSVSVVPALVPCDFHPGQFKPERWNQRTCPKCAAKRTPDQSLLGWEAYQAALKDWQRRQGVRPALTQAQVALRSRGSRTRFPAGKRLVQPLSSVPTGKMHRSPSTTSFSPAAQTAQESR